MKEKRNTLASAIRSALSAGALAGFGMAALSVSAQEADDSDQFGPDLERMQVTGSRIQGADIEAANPVASFDREDIERVSAGNLGELIQRLAPENTGAPLTTQTNNGGNGAVTVDLRGFGRTLVLINGRRIVDGGDFQAISTMMVERIDILKTGASAIYGVDAVAGVVNVITRTNFQGAEFFAEYRRPQDFSGSADNRTVSGIFGIANEKGYANVGFERRKQDGVTQGQFDDPDFLGEPRLLFDADAFAENGNDPFGPGSVFLGSSRIPQGAFDIDSNRDADGDTVPLATRPGTDGTDPNNDFFEPDFALGSPTSDTFNFAPFNFLQTPFETKNFFAHAGYDLHENVEIYFEGRYNSRESEQLLAPTPFDTGRFLDPGFTVPNDDRRSGVSNGISADNAFNPFGEDVLRVRRRIVEGERRFEQKIDQFQTVIGLKGDIPFAPGWTYDGNLNYGERTRQDIDSGQFIGARLQQALGPSFFDAQGNAVCGTPDDPIEGCVPLNLFGGPGSITQEMLEFVSAPAVDSIKSDQEIWNVSFAGPAIELPAGPLSVAFGGEFRDESFLTTPDSNKAIDNISGNTFSQIGGSQQVISFFAEANIPLLRDIPLAKSLEAKVAFRFDDFETDLDERVGSEPTNEFDNDSFEIGLRWRPFDDLLVRGTFAEVFTAPAVGTLFGPLSDNFQQAQDPCAASNFGNLSDAEQQACFDQGVNPGGVNNPDPQPLTRTGGNPNAGPEDGETYTAGFVFTPTFVPGLSLTVDWWRIELDDALTTIDTGTILAQCVSNDNTFALCDGIERGSSGEISQVTSRIDNISSEDGEGIDLSFSYDYNAGTLGMFQLGGSWTHLIERERETFPGVFTTLEGRFDADGDEGFAEDKFNGFVTWDYGDFKIDYSAQFVGSYQADLLFFPGEQSVPSQLYHDVQFGWASPWNTDVTFGVNNITDNNPPFIDAAFNANVDEANHRVFGRVFTVNMTTRF